MADVRTILARSTVTSPPADPLGVGTFLVTSGEDARFPATGEFFAEFVQAGQEPSWASGSASGGNFEICRVSRASGSMTILERGILGTGPRAIQVQDQIRLPHLPVEDFPRVGVQPTSASPAVAVSPLTSGLFMDFAGGVHGVKVLASDPPSPHWLDQVSVNPGNTLVYDTSNLLAGLPSSIRMTTTSAGGACNGVFANTGYPAPLVDGGRFYFRPNVRPDNNIKSVRYNNNAPAGAGIATFIRFNRANAANMYFDVVDNSNNVKTPAGSRASVLAGQWYRIEWLLDYVAGTVEVWTFDTHSTTPIDHYVTSSWDQGKNALSVQWFSDGGAFNGKYVQYGAIAAACPKAPGPYLGRPNALQVVDPTGKYRVEIGNNGEIVLRANREIILVSGGTGHYMIQPGDIVGRIGGEGAFFGPNLGIGNPAGLDDSDNMDSVISVFDQRSSFHSGNFRAHEDPADLNFTSMSSPDDPLNASVAFVGFAASTTEGSDIITLTDIDDPLNPTLATTAGVNAVDSTTFHATSLTGWPNRGSFTVTVGAALTTTCTAVQSGSTISLASVTGLSTAGGFVLLTTAGGVKTRVNYTGISGLDLTGCSAHPTTAVGNSVVAVPDVRRVLYNGKSGNDCLNCTGHPATAGGETVKPAFEYALDCRGCAILVGPVVTVNGSVGSGGTNVPVKQTTNDDAWGNTGYMRVGTSNNYLQYTARSANAFTVAANDPKTGSAHVALNDGDVLRKVEGFDWNNADPIIANKAVWPDPGSDDANRKRGDVYNILEIVSPTTIKVKPVPTVTATGLIWRQKIFPYARDYTGTGSDGTVGQVRGSPTVYPYVWEGAAGTTGMTTTASSDTAQAPGFTSADIGRFVVINDDLTLNPSKGSYEVKSVNNPNPGDVQFTEPVSQSLTNVKFVVCGKPEDGGGKQLQGNAMTISMKAVNHQMVVTQGTDRYASGGKWEFNGIDGDKIYCLSGAPGGEGADPRYTGQYTTALRVDLRGPVTAANGPLRAKQIALTYGTTVTPNAGKGSLQTLTVTNGTAFTVANPTNPPETAITQRLTLIIFNNSGGAMGAITWGSQFVFPTAWTNPANTKRKSVTFDYDPLTNKWVAGVPSADY